MYEKGRISVTQLFLWMLIFFTAGSSANSLDILFSRQDSFVSNLAAILPGILTVYVMVKLQKRYPDLSFFEMTEEILGRWPGNLINFIFVYFAIEVCLLYARGFGEFVLTTLTPEMTIDLYLICIVLVGAYGVYLGIEAIARLAQLLFPFYILLIIIINALLVRQFHLDFLLPVFDHKAGEMIYSTFLQYVFPMGEAIFFIGVLPYVKQSKHLFKAAAGSLVLAGIFLAYRGIVAIGVLGTGAAVSSNFPFFDAIRLVKIGEFIERIDIFFLGIFVMAVLIQFITIFYFITHGVAHIFQVKTLKPMLIPMAILIFALSKAATLNVVDIFHYLMFIRPFTGPIYMLVLPVLLLFVSFIRKPRDSHTDLSPFLEK